MKSEFTNKWIINEKYTNLMKNCEHGYRGEKNPYHLEGSVYTHTMMVIKEIKKLTTDLILLAAAQLHDIGKPLARHEKNNRVYFSGHEGISAYLALNYAKEQNLNPSELFKLVALHGVLYKYPKPAMIDKSFTPEFWKKLSTLIKADHLGRKTTQDKTPLLALLNHNASKGEALTHPYLHEASTHPDTGEVLLSKSEQEKSRDSEPLHTSTSLSNCATALQKEKSTLIILIGPPNSGKSTYIKNNIHDYKIISRDELVLKYANTNNYDQAFNNLSREDHEKINMQLDIDYRNHLKNYENIVIDMTNMSPKSRRKWTNAIKRKEYNIKFVMFLTPFDKIMERNKNRKNKHIPKSHIIMFMNKFSYPLPYKEKYDELEIVLDEELCYQH